MTAPAAPPTARPSLRFKETCERCSRQVAKHSRFGYTWRCPHCGFVNIGPGYRAQDRTPPEGTRRRVARREKATEDRAAAAAAPEPAGSGSPRPAPAPVRRKRSTPVDTAPPATSTPAGRRAATSSRSGAGAGAEPAGEGRQPAVPSGAAPPAGRRRGWLDRVMWGEGEGE